MKNHGKGDGPSTTSEKTDDIENLEDEILRLPTDDIVGRYRLLDSELRILRSEATRINNEMQNLKDRIKVRNRFFVLYVCMYVCYIHGC